MFQEFLVAAGNPKAILVFTAFLPQFIDPAKPLPAQFVILGGLFLAMEWIAIAIYAYAGIHLRNIFGTVRGLMLFNRSCAALLASSGRCRTLGVSSRIPLNARPCKFGGLPALTARFVMDLMLGCSVFQAVRPKMRLDLY